MSLTWRKLIENEKAAHIGRVEACIKIFLHQESLWLMKYRNETIPIQKYISLRNHTIHLTLPPLGRFYQYPHILHSFPIDQMEYRFLSHITAVLDSENGESRQPNLTTCIATSLIHCLCILLIQVTRAGDPTVLYHYARLLDQIQKWGPRRLLPRQARTFCAYMFLERTCS